MPEKKVLAVADDAKSEAYRVLARKYRPDSFEKLRGQVQVATALRNAIVQQRVGHAYLFTGARGVGKTSTARIFAKCLNCLQGPTPTPCNQCDICLGIATGDDIDVLEIDGASNNGVEEVRQLRANASLRPSRARLKIYIIDEVHMLTKSAFNALLKTLEEPPDHVKFIFCTTDAEKIPITVLSRCQRFDFVPISSSEIVQSLRQVVSGENRAADDEALVLLARRAAGSLRDAQSLLDQLLSFTSEKLTAGSVHALLGTAPATQLTTIMEALVERKTATVLAEINRASDEGVDASQLAQQLLGMIRDLMAAAIGCDADLMLYSGPDDMPWLKQTAARVGLPQWLAMAQVVDQALVRMRQTTYPRTLLETAAVRICALEDLSQIAALVAQLQAGHAPPPQATGQSRGAATPPADSPASVQRKGAKKNEKLDSVNTPPTPVCELSEQTAETVWRKALASLGDMTADFAGHYQSLQLSAPGRLTVAMTDRYHRDVCRRPDRKSRLESAVEQLTGTPVLIEFVLSELAGQADPQPAPLSRQQQLRELEKHPFVETAIELFDVEITDWQAPRGDAHKP